MLTLLQSHSYKSLTAEEEKIPKDQIWKPRPWSGDTGMNTHTLHLKDTKPLEVLDEDVTVFSSF